MQCKALPQDSPTIKSSVLTKFSEEWLKAELGRLLRRREKERGGTSRDAAQEFCVRAGGNVTVRGGEIRILKTPGGLGVFQSDIALT